MTDSSIEKMYHLAREKYAEIGVNTERVLTDMDSIAISLHCWQGDDVSGFESPNAVLGGGGIQVTGHYPGRARTIKELRTDLNRAFSLIPGSHHLNLHAMYGEFDTRPADRDEIEDFHFQGWVEWARQQKLKLDFNCTCFSHPRADSGFTLSSRDKNIRRFWIEHVKRCRSISEYMGKELQNTCIHNIWIPDGYKDLPVDRWIHRKILTNSLDEIFAEDYDPKWMKDSLESKLFGIGSEAYVVGSHDFYMGYALSRKKMLCLDLGHFHPTESVADKLSAIMRFSPEILLHISRSIRWDSDHVVILNDELLSLAKEIIRGGVLKNVHIALDFFDASINRVGAWVIGARATLKSFLFAMLEAHEVLREAESRGDYFTRLARLEEGKSLPFGAVWDYYCRRKNVPPEGACIEAILEYDRNVTQKRG
jgi:L-rhamnose isomerase